MPDVRIGRLRVRHLQLLDAVARHPSLTSAAAALAISQPRATNMLREIEEAFSCQLLERAPRGMRINDAGIAALQRLRIALGALDAARATLRAAAPRPLVRLGVLPLVGSDRLALVAAQLQREQALPRLALRTGVVGDLLDLLAGGEVDAILCGLDAGRPLPSAIALHTAPLWEERNVVIAASDHPIVRKRRLSLTQVLDEPWLLMPSQSANRQALERMFLRAGLIPPEPLIEAETPQSAISFVSQGRMLALVPETAVRLAAGRVRPLRLDADLPSTWINLITLKDVPSLPFLVDLVERLKVLAGDGQARTA